MADNKSRYTVEAQAKGFDKLDREFAGMQKSVARSSKQMASLAATLKSLEKSFSSRAGSQQMEALRKAAEATTKAVQALTQAKAKDSQQEDEEARKKKLRARDSLSFHRGFLQGSGLGEYFPEETKRGLYRNIAGRAAGRMAQGAFAGMMAPFTGAAGFSAALAAIPAVGGFMSGQFQAGLGAAEGALGTRQQLWAMQGLRHHNVNYGVLAEKLRERSLSKAEIDARVAAAGKKAYDESMAGGGHFAEVIQARRAVQLGEMDQGPADHAANWLGSAPTWAQPWGAAGAAIGEAIRPSRDLRPATDEMGKDIETAERVRLRDQRKRLAEEAARNDEKAERERLEQARKDTEADALDKAFTAPLEAIRAMSQRMGLGPQEGLQATSGFLGMSGIDLNAIGGPSATDRRSTRWLQTAMGAQARYGIDMETAGAFARGEHSGATADGLGDFQKAILSGRSMNLSGPELAGYVRDIASRVMQFEQTGIPVAQDSLTSLQQGLAGSLGALRGNVLASQAQGAFQRIGNEGPQSAAEFLAFREVGGYKGGGIKDYYQAAKAMESGGANAAQGLFNMISKVQTTGSMEGNNLAVQGLLKRLNINASLTDVERLVGGDQAMAGQFADALTRGRSMLRDTGDPADMTAPDMIQRQARGAWERDTAGGKLIPVLQDLNSTSTNMVANVAAFSRELNVISKSAAETSLEFRGAIKAFAKVVDNLAERVGMSK